MGLLGLAPHSPAGLIFRVVGVIAARVLWAGILTVRASIWTANYPRQWLAQITGRMVVVAALGIAAAAVLAGLLLEWAPQQTHWLYLGAGLLGGLAAWLYRLTRVRREYQLLAAEVQAVGETAVFSLGVLRQILRDDPQYRRFMFWKGLYGAGNLMVGAQLVIVFTDHLHLSSSVQIALLSVVPLLCVPLFTPMWARLFDGGHVIDYRARQCWALVLGIALMTAGAFSHYLVCLWLGALMFGVATAGANLGWNLGHSDFASLGKMQQYMGVNVTLTGLRGLVAPQIGVLVYEWLDSLWAGAGRWSLLLPLAMTVAGAIGFNQMREARTSHAAQTKAQL